jgi:hypothetical protein
VIARQLIPRFVLLAAGLVASCARNPAAPPSEQLDHVILGISNLDRGIEQLGAVCGVKPVPGGKHPDTGTHNALLSMGSRSYAEVLAPQDGARLAPLYHPLRAVANLLPVGWAVATRDADLTIQKLRAGGYAVSEPQEGSRQTTDGSMIRWRTFQLTAPKIEGAPFFIEWEAASAHPATTSPVGCPLLSLELRTPHDEELRRLLSLLKVQGRVSRSEASQLVVTLKGSRGPTRLPGGD